MTVAAVMVNGHRICHGGYIFSLADSAFAFACNSADEAAVASHCAVTFLRPAREGEELVAHAERRAEAGRALVVGAGTGYGAALLAACGAEVTALEDDERLAAIGRRVLEEMADAA